MKKTLWITTVAVSLHAATALAFEFAVLSTPLTDDLLYRLDRDSFQSSQIGSFGGNYDDVSNLACNGLIYTVDRATDRLVTLDPDDASILSAVQLDTDVTKQGRGIDFSPEGDMYGIFAGPQLRTINPATGQTSLVASFSLGLIEAIAFSPTGTLYAIGHANSTSGSNRLYTLNMTTGAHTFIAEMAVSDLDCLTYAPDGYLYAADSTTSAASLYRITPSNGTLTNVGSSGIAYFNGIAVLPEPMTLVLLTLGSLVMIRSGHRQRR